MGDTSHYGSAPVGVYGEVLTSGDLGQSWQKIERQPVYGVYPGLTHCQPAGSVSGALDEARCMADGAWRTVHGGRCMADETSFFQPAGTANKPRQAVVLAQRFNGSTGEYIGSMNTTWKFLNNLGSAGDGNKDHFEMDMDGSVVQLDDGSLLATSYGPFADGRLGNCSLVNSTPTSVPAHNGFGVLCTSVFVSRSVDGGATWMQVGVASDTPSKTEMQWPCFAGSENNVLQLAGTGTLLAVWRAGGPAHQPPTGEPICGATSADGVHWLRPQALGWSSAAVANASRALPFNMSCPHPYGVDPKLAQLHSGLLALSAGRVGMHVWLAPSIKPTDGNVLEQLAAEDKGGWLGLNLAQAHNDLVSLADMPADMRYTKSYVSNFCMATCYLTPGVPCDDLCEFESTSYTGMVNIPGTDRILISYEKTTGTYNEGSAPSQVGDRSYIFVMELRVTKTGSD